jgi:hypothetical protein
LSHQSACGKIEYKKSTKKLMLAYIGLGSNLNNPKQQIKDALIALNSMQDVKVVALSSLYQSKHYTICVCCFFAKHTTLIIRRKSKELLSRNI